MTAPRLKALIIGVSGQDGAYLAKLLAEKNYEVYGTSRNGSLANFESLKLLGVYENINIIRIAPTNYDSVYDALSFVRPDEIYNLSAQSSVGLSFITPLETIESISVSMLNILESVRLLGLKSKIYNAGSSEMFGDTGLAHANESTNHIPVSPYGLAKSTAALQVSMYREVYGLHACTGILFNHESPLRNEKYVTKKIVSSACRIGLGSAEKLSLGNTDIYRDWGYAPEYVDAMWRMLQVQVSQDFVIATGQSNSLTDFVIEAFTYFGLNWNDHVTIDKGLMRTSDIKCSVGNPEKAKKILEWEAKTFVPEIVKIMIEHELQGL